MKKYSRAAFIFLLLSICLLPACGSGQFFGPAPVPTPTFTPTATRSPTQAPTPAVSALNNAIPLKCEDQAGAVSGAYRAENNTWGKGTLSGWSQCIGLGMNPDGTLVGRWTWDWLNSGTTIKAYPEVVFGQKPGSATTSPVLPKKINSVSELLITYDITSTHTGSGNISFDIWLTDTQNPATWGVPPMSHEIMIWLDRYGGTASGGHWLETVKLDGTEYEVNTSEKWGDGWKYIAFVQKAGQPLVGVLNLRSLLSYLQSKGLATGEEYIASIEIGNEVANGSGETILNQYAISIR